MLTLGRTKYQKFEAIVVIILVVGFLLFKGCSYLLESAQENMMKEQPAIAKLLENQYEANEISVTVTFDTMAVWMYDSPIINQVKEERDSKALEIAQMLQNNYDGELKAITLAFISTENDVLKTVAHNYEIIDGHLKKKEK